MKFGKSLRLALAALMVGVVALFGMTGSAVAKDNSPGATARIKAEQVRKAAALKARGQKPRKVKPAPRLIHPCDVGNENGRLDSTVERLCIKVWEQEAYEITHKNGSVSGTPDGAVVVIDLVQQWRDQDMGINQLIDDLKWEHKQYGKRDGA